AAIALAGAGVATALVAGRPRPPDNRTTMLLAGSVTALETLGVWTRCAAPAAPLSVMRIIDDTARLLRAPAVSFAPNRLGLAAFGPNTETRHLPGALTTRAGGLPALAVTEDDVAEARIDDTAVTLRLAGGRSIAAQLAIGADGRRSLCRGAAGIGAEGWRY